MSGSEYFFFEQMADADGVVDGALLEISGGVIKKALSASRRSLPASTHVFEGYRAYPGLINLHEHLACPVFRDPQVEAGDGNSREWVLRRYGKAGRVFERLIPLLLAGKYLLPHLLPLGVGSDPTNLLRLDPWPGFQTRNLYCYNSWRNLLSGVTTVLDHSPYAPQMPLRLLRNKYALHGLRWQSAQFKLLLAFNNKRRLPVYIHLGDGIDSESAADWQRLVDAGGLRDDVRLVHGVNLTPPQLAACREAGMRLVWCPVCSERMFGRLADIPAAEACGLALALATDAMDTGSFSLLEEMGRAAELYRRHYGGELAPRRIFEMVTSVPADWHADEARLGRLRPGCRADFFAVRSGGADPYAHLPGLNTAEVAGVWRDGLPLILSEELRTDAGMPPAAIRIRREEKIFLLCGSETASVAGAERAWKKLKLPSLWERL